MATGTYTAITAAAAIDALGKRLSDPTFVHWTQAELQRYLNEALRTWNALTSDYRTTGVFSTTSLEPFYVIPTMLPVARGYTVTVRDLVLDIEYTLLEPPNSTSWSGTDQYDLATIVAAIERRRDLFLQQTQVIQTRRLLTNIAPPPQGKLLLPEEIISIRRMAWKTTDGVIAPVRRDDSWGASHYRPGWVQQTSRPPIAFAESATAPLVVQLVPAPLDTGTLDLLTVDRGATLSTSANTLLGVPDDWAWVVKFGALADLWQRDGLALDPQRAQYAQQRWTDGIARAMGAPVVVDARVMNRDVPIDTVANADRYASLWQTVPGNPSRILTAGQNLIALWPPPGVPLGGGSFSVTLNVVANMPVAIDTGTFLQIGPELLDPILDYAQHLAITKDGAGALALGQTLLDRFTAAAGVTINIQQATQPARRLILEQTANDQHAQPAQLPAGDAA